MRGRYPLKGNESELKNLPTIPQSATRLYSDGFRITISNLTKTLAIPALLCRLRGRRRRSDVIGTYSETYNLLGGPSVNAQNMIGTETFQVQVSASESASGISWLHNSFSYFLSKPGSALQALDHCTSTPFGITGIIKDKAQTAWPSRGAYHKEKRGKMRAIQLAATLTLLTSAGTSAADSVLLTSRRGGWIEVFDPATLATVFRTSTPANTESVAADPSGTRLYFSAPKNAGESCCALYAIDLNTMHLTYLNFPVLRATPSSGRVYMQRGNVGIESFDSSSLKRLPTWKAAGVYNLQPSPDGKRIFGVTHFPSPSLDLFDAAQGVQIASQPLPQNQSIAGVWVGERYYLFQASGGRPSLRPVGLEDAKLGPAVPLASASEFPDCAPAPYSVIAAGSKVAIFAGFGLKSDGICKPPGGYVLADPDTGAVLGRFASTMHFRQMVSSDDGRYVYGLDVGNHAWKTVRIVKLDASTGQLMTERTLEPDVWYLTSGTLAR